MCGLCSSSLFSFTRITGLQVYEQLMSMKRTRSAGVDGVSVSQIYDAIGVLGPVLELLYNSVITTSIYPKPWKRSLINSPDTQEGER